MDINFITRLKKFIDENELTQTDVAELFGVSQKTISIYLRMPEKKKNTKITNRKYSKFIIIMNEYTNKSKICTVKLENDTETTVIKLNNEPDMLNNILDLIKDTYIKNTISLNTTFK